MENKKYFYGNEISEYGVQNNRVDYRALANSFDAVLCNDITKLFDNPYYFDLVNGDYYYYENSNGDILSVSEYEELEPEQREGYEEIYNDIYQYFIIDSAGYRILTEDTNEIVFYNKELDIAIWGVTHYGTAWNYVLTDIKINDMEG